MATLETIHDLSSNFIDSVSEIHFFNKSNKLVAVSKDKTGKIFNLVDGTAALDVHTSDVNSCNIKDDDSQIVTVTLN